MPLYEYRCSQCGSVFELIQKVEEPPLKKCLKCGGDVHKIISPPALQFKGSGWYITDYAQKNSSAEQKKDISKTEPSSTTKDTKAISSTPKSS